MTEKNACECRIQEPPNSSYRWEDKDSDTGHASAGTGRDWCGHGWCGPSQCRLHWMLANAKVVYCPKHASAPDLRDACNRLGQEKDAAMKMILRLLDETALICNKPGCDGTPQNCAPNAARALLRQAGLLEALP